MSRKGDAGGELGASNILSFLRISLRGSRSTENKSSAQTERLEERVFTPTSLFSRLRDSLNEEHLIRDLDLEGSFDELNPGEFVEFTAILRRNPLPEMIDDFIQLAGSFEKFTALEERQVHGQHSSPGRPKGGAQNQKQPRGKSQEETLIEQFTIIRDLVTQSNRHDLLAIFLDGHRQAVIPVEVEYFSDSTPAALIDGQFTVIGKAVRVVKDGSGNSIDLLRGTQLGMFQQQLIDTLPAAFAAMGQSGLEPRALVTRIEGPALQLVPIAIYI